MPERHLRIPMCQPRGSRTCEGPRLDSLATDTLAAKRDTYQTPVTEERWKLVSNTRKSGEPRQNTGNGPECVTNDFIKKASHGTSYML